MRILITGSSGFIGGNLADYLLAAGHEVIGLDKRIPVVSNPGVQFQHCDVVDSPRLTAIMARFVPDAVIHLAAQTELNEKEPDAYDANIAGVENLVGAIRAAKSVRRAIFTSTQLVCHVGYVPKSDTDYAPTTLYGKSKVLTEKIVRERDGGNIEWCLGRPTTVWGPGMKPHYQRFFGMIRRGRYFHVGPRPLYKSYGYVGNVICQYLRILEAPTAQIHRKVFYLADYAPLSLRAWANAFQREFKAPPIPTCPESIARLAARLGDVINICGFKSFPFNSFRLNNVLTEYTFDLGATEAVCGPLPFTVDQGVQETVKWLNTCQT
ncbi:MAG: NAD(P)-dependent oxidoreductase [Verrucomicrobia bacterium]|nr:NAD(P)-dependent oxidoreductase [Verrucomicrobiota bacterium]